ncbi:helix-turn-helix transcriptional regulator [bacterium]|nr:helix-turn-helix transcriptional regulator [bacterium]
MIKNTEKILNSVIDILKRERIARGISHEKLAILAGVHRTSIGHLEAKITKPTLFLCLKIAEALNLKLSDILKEAEKKNNYL